MKTISTFNTRKEMRKWLLKKFGTTDQFKVDLMGDTVQVYESIYSEWAEQHVVFYEDNDPSSIITRMITVGLPPTDMRGRNVYYEGTTKQIAEELKWESVSEVRNTLRDLSSQFPDLIAYSTSDHISPTSKLGTGLYWRIFLREVESSEIVSNGGAIVKERSRDSDEIANNNPLVDKITLYEELFRNMKPNRHRGNMACFEGTAKYIANTLEKDSSEVLRVLKHFRNDRSSTLVSYSGDGNIKPRTTNSSTLYWRINLGTIQVVKHKDEKPPKKSPKKKSKKKENKGNKEKPCKKKKRKFDFS